MVNYCIITSVVYLSLGCRFMGVLSVCLLLISNKPSNLSQLWDILALLLLLLLFNINCYPYFQDSIRSSVLLRVSKEERTGDCWHSWPSHLLPPLYSLLAPSSSSPAGMAFCSNCVSRLGISELTRRLWVFTKFPRINICWDNISCRVWWSLIMIIGVPVVIN